MKAIVFVLIGLFSMLSPVQAQGADQWDNLALEGLAGGWKQAPAPVEPRLLDLAPSGYLDSDDLRVFSERWYENETDFKADFDGSGRVDSQDLLTLLGGMRNTPEVPKLFIPLPGGGPAPLTVEFLYTDPIEETQIESWAWDFDSDGAIDSADPNPVHVYVASGTYTVSLTVQTPSGETLSQTISDCVVVREPVTPIVADNVVVVDNDPCLAYVSQATGELILEELCPPIDPINIGTIVVGSHEGGYARRVLSIQTNGSQLILQTDEIALTEIFDQADIAAAVQITPEDLVKAGFSIGPDGRATKEYEESFSDVLTLSGDVTFDPAFTCQLVVKDQRLVYASAGLIADLGVNVKAEFESNADFEDSEEIKLRTIPEITKIVWIQVGVVPVIVKAKLSFYAGYEAEFQGSFRAEAGYSVNTRAEFALEYNDGVFGPKKPQLTMTPRRIGPEI